MRLTVDPARDVNVLQLKPNKVVTQLFAASWAWRSVIVKGPTTNEHQQTH